jgi:hypothetical protein
MQTVADIFAVWPSDAEFGRDVGVAYTTAASWKQRGSIPAAYWHQVTEAAKRRGRPEVTADLLARLHARDREETPSGLASSGFAEEGRPFMVSPGDVKVDERPELKASRGFSTGHFSRWKHLRRSNFASGDEIAAHVDALREEWARR